MTIEQKFQVGDHVSVGKFFWTDEDKCIGFDDDARHGHRLFFGGSVNIGDVLIIRGIEGENAIVRVNKRDTPYGAPCPHGMIFSIPLADMEKWPGDHSGRYDVEMWRSDMMRKYVKKEKPNDH